MVGIYIDTFNHTLKTIPSQGFDRSARYRAGSLLFPPFILFNSDVDEVYATIHKNFKDFGTEADLDALYRLGRPLWSGFRPREEDEYEIDGLKNDYIPDLSLGEVLAMADMKLRGSKKIDTNVAVVVLRTSIVL